MELLKLIHLSRDKNQLGGDVGLILQDIRLLRDLFSILLSLSSQPTKALELILLVNIRSDVGIVAAILGVFG